MTDVPTSPELEMIGGAEAGVKPVEKLEVGRVTFGEGLERVPAELRGPSLLMVPEDRFIREQLRLREMIARLLEILALDEKELKEGDFAFLVEAREEARR